MKIHLIANDGSPIGVTPPIIHERGVGGAELAMMTLMEVFADRGHEVTVYNDPTTAGDYSGVFYRPLAEFITEHERDVLIVFRSPNNRINHDRIPKTQKVIWWSTDQITVGDFSALAAKVNHVVTISPFHTDYFANHYSIPDEKMHRIDLGVRTWEYKEDIAKVPNRLIMCSIPDRGLQQLLVMWPKILAEVPDASLVITSDYRLWGAPGAGNSQHRLMWIEQASVDFLGCISREELVKEQMKAEIMSYPCTYDELFCISAAECQVAGAIPVTTEKGALVTTNEYGVVLPGDPTNANFVNLYVEQIVNLLQDRDTLFERQTQMKKAAFRRFSYRDRIVQKWEELFLKGN